MKSLGGLTILPGNKLAPSELADDGSKLRERRLVVAPLSNLNQRLRLLSFQNMSSALVLVGGDKVQFSVHKDLLCETSKFFRAALLGKFKEGLEQTVPLPEDDPKVFDQFVNWLYTGKTTLTLNDTNLDLFILADKIDAARLKNDIVDFYLQPDKEENHLLWGAPAAAIYCNLSEQCGMRKLILHKTADRASSYRFQDDEYWKPMEEYPEFVLHLAKAFAKKLQRPKESMVSNEKCAYHEHSKIGTPGRDAECATLEIEALQEAERNKWEHQMGLHDRIGAISRTAGDSRTWKETPKEPRGRRAGG